MDPNPQETATLLAYLRGDLDSEKISTLEQQLLEDEELRKTLLELSTEESLLTDWAKAEHVSITLDDKTFSKEGGHYSTENAGWWAAAAVLILSTLSIVWINQSNQTTIASPKVAQLISSADAEWQGVAPELNSNLAMGHYQLAAGIIDLLFTDGAKVSVSGPADFDIKSSRHIHLNTGNLVAQIPDEALGFIVTSPQSEVVDLGTEFGLSVTNTGQTDVHVIDGLVEVIHANDNTGVLISEGEARRFNATTSTAIPIASRAGLIGDQRLRMLRGSVRIVESISKSDLIKTTVGPNWIDLVAEKSNVALTEPLDVSIDAPGNYRNFAQLNKSLPAGSQVNSYLLHFRPGSTNHVNGVIRFDQPIVAILCKGEHLDASDTIFGIPSVHYPGGTNPFRGLEPNGFPTKGGKNKLPGWKPDEIILSQERHTISIHTFANTERGYDQIRILTRAH